MRKWSGVICIEGVQTGDGRIMVEGALEWADPPLPLGWLQEEMHGMMLSGGVQIGTIETIERVGNEIHASGLIDDETAEGAELARRMDAGTASHGEAAFVSVDPDDWELEIVAMDEDSVEEIVLLASGSGQPPALRAAAGEGDPSEEGTVLFEDASDAFIERYTRLRIRGVTVCAIPAFDGAFISLDAAEASTDEPAEEPEAESVEAAGGPVYPPSEWFEDPKFTELTPLTITDDGRVFGHVAAWDTCHIGIAGQCVTPPRSASNYAYFTTGATRLADGVQIPTGVITLGTGHMNDLRADFRKAMEHYDNTGTAAADVAVGDDDFGPWIAGALRSGLTDEQIRALRGAAISGDWRPIAGNRELVAALAVNVPGFPIPRPRVLVASGEPIAMVAAAVVSEDDCGCEPTVAPTRSTAEEYALRKLAAREAGSLNSRVMKPHLEKQVLG